MIEVASREAAIEWAKKCPASDNEVIEIRQVHEVTEYPEEMQRVAAEFTELQPRSAAGR